MTIGQIEVAQGDAIGSKSIGDDGIRHPTP
jgi:hypothetical protein